MGLALGLGAAFGPRAFDDANASRESSPTPTGAAPLGSLSTEQLAGATKSAGAALASMSSAPDPPSAPAPTARAAIDAFLVAEVDGRYDTSYGLLSAPDRARAGGGVAWSADHANLPPIVGFTIESVVETGAEASAMTATRLRPSLDEFVGLVPARASATWIAVREDGGWRVAYSRSRLVPQYPPDSLAADAAHEWVTARQECRRAAEWSGGVLGPVMPARRLCRVAGAVALGAPSELIDDSGAADVTAAFGPDAYAWARLVPVLEPARLDLIVAPVGERWLVIGVRTASPGTR